VACREEADRDELIRLVLSPDGKLVVDYRGKLPGRGAWVHPSRACVESLEQKPGPLARAFSQSVDASGLLAAIRGQVEAAVLDGLSLAAAAGALFGGHDVLSQAIREGRVVEIVVASDASVRTLSELRAIAGEEMAFTPVPLGKEALGNRIGRGARAALGVAASRAASHLRRQLHRLRSLG
jgi:predicted RNA-binding protein YlxR (DUF448 family)